MSNYYRRKRHPIEVAITSTWYSVTDNQSVHASPKSERAAEAMAICAARATGYGAYSIGRGGEVLHVERFRCDLSGDRHVYAFRYSAEKFCDVPVIVAPAGSILP